MECPKCSGMMHSERVSDFIIVFHVFRCINCGEVLDDKIQNNREQSLLVIAIAGGVSMTGNGFGTKGTEPL